jgi:Glycosyltransferase family 87
MKFTKPDLHFLVLCISALILFAVGGARVIHSSNDFVPVYTGARCLLHGCNPYDPSQLEQQFFQGGGHAEELPSWQIDVPVYPPSTFLALSPLALLRYPIARWLWFLLNGSLLVTSAGLILSICPPWYRWLATFLVSFIVATAGILLVLGQPGVFAIPLVIIGSCLFLRGRKLPLAAFLLMLSLAVKPQIGGFIVLYLLLQRIHWRYAAVALAGAGALLLSATLILGHHPRSAGWASTLHANLTATLSPGGSADPRPENQIAIGDVNLQTLSSIFFADERRFNAVAYAVFLGLLAVGIVAVMRANAGPETHFLALAALSILSLTPVYHRFYDTRLLLLSIPAVVIVFQKRRLLGTLIAVLTVLAVVSVQYRVQMFLLQQAKWQSVLANKFLFILLLRQQNLELLLLFCLYLAAIFSTRFSSAAAIEAHPLHEPAIPLQAR